MREFLKDDYKSHIDVPECIFLITVFAKYTVNGFPLNYDSGATTLTIFVQKQENNFVYSLEFTQLPSIRAKSGLCITCTPNFRVCLLCIGSILT